MRFLLLLGLGLALAGCAGGEAEHAPRATFGPGAGAIASTSVTAPQPDEQQPSASGPGPSGAPGAPEEPEPTGEPDAAAAALDAVHDYWDAVVAAGDPPDPDHPALAEHLTGPALEHSRGVLEGHRADGNRVRDPSGVTPMGVLVDVVDERSATAWHCLVDDAVVIDVASGDVVEDEVRAMDVRLSLVHDGERWRVEHNERVRERADGSC